ncbi:nascent polypeptide-associated complex subunit alpha, muscle-specific form-like isoform X2 [Fopius arisanus]|nr:PREDICTED: nascent polypeptide-associated complex subunit alpha, muscle-specific form-like isoform X2 [Fopius arisanus]XP_011302389.1 PREDICTED: nascent polypeptide-associated complex subunit alpha, muscle-specific form-like isoform X2 [Fopius arisanus]
MITGKLHLGDSDCGEGGPNRPTRGPCDPPEGPCEPMKKPGYPGKPRATREPFCVKCPPKRPCNLNKCPTETEGTSWRSACQQIAFILCSQSQRSCRLGGIHVRNYGTLKRPRIIGDLRPSQAPGRFKSGKGCDKPPEASKCEDEGKPKEISCSTNQSPDPPVKVVYQKCPPCPKLPKIPECVPPAPTCEIKCPPLPKCPKCPPCPPPEDSKDKCAPVKSSKGAACTSTGKSAKGLWDKLTGFMKKRKMSTSSGADNWKSSKCQTVTDICSNNSEKKEPSPPPCPKNRRTSCYPDTVKCPELEETPEIKVEPFVEEKIDYSKFTCPPPKFERLEVCPSSDINSSINSTREETISLLMGLPGPPSEPVTLCPCPPPAKLHPGACPCAPEVTNTKKPTPTEPCPLKPLHPCPDKRVFYCPPQPSASSQRKKA